MTFHRLLHFIRLGATPRRALHVLSLRPQPIVAVRRKVTVPAPRPRAPAEEARPGFYEIAALAA
jgi:hypothetical protein